MLDDLSQEVSGGNLRGPIDVVEMDGKMYTLNNRRLAAAQLIDAEVPVRIRDISDPEVEKWLDRHMTTPQEVDGAWIQIRGTDLRIGPW